MYTKTVFFLEIPQKYFKPINLVLEFFKHDLLINTFLRIQYIMSNIVAEIILLSYTIIEVIFFLSDTKTFFVKQILCERYIGVLNQKLTQP